VHGTDMTQACHGHEWCLCHKNQNAFADAECKGEEPANAKDGHCHARVLKPHVSCMSAMGLVINKAHTSVHLPQHAVQYPANMAHSQTQ